MSGSRRYPSGRYPYLSALGPAEHEDDALFIQAQLRAYRLHEERLARLENQHLARITSAAASSASASSSAPSPRRLRIAERMLALRTEITRRREDLLEDMAALDAPVEVVDEDKPEADNEVVDLDKENSLPAKPKKKKEPPPTCCIDLEPILPGETVVRLPCMCVFHQKCLMPYLLSAPNPRCPIDRTPIRRSDIHLLPVFKWVEKS